MKKVVFIFVIVCVISLSISFVGAMGESVTELVALAENYPSDTAFFIGFRTDDAFVDELDTLLSSIRSRIPPELLPEDYEMKTVREGLDKMLEEGDVTYDEIRVWLGDHGAMGIIVILDEDIDNFDGDVPFQYKLVLEIIDRPALEAFLTDNQNFTGLTQSVDESGATVLEYADGEDFTAIITITDDLATMVISNHDTTEAQMDGSLATNPDFMQGISAMSAPFYNAVAYADLFQFLEPQLDEIDDEILDLFTNAGFDLNSLGGTLTGVTILDDRSLTVDIVQLYTDTAGLLSTSNVDPSFARFIPRDASLVIHGTDLSGSINQLLETIAQVVPEDTEQDPVETLEFATRFFGLDLQEDILSWITGDYALFATLDLEAILELFQSGGSTNLESLPVEFGFIIEATDPDAAQNVALRLGNTLELFAASSEDDVTIGEDTISGVEVVTLSGEVPVDDFGDATFLMEIVMGANDEIFFISTRESANQYLTGDGVLATNPTFIEASEYFLPDANMIAYTNHSGLLTMIASSAGTSSRFDMPSSRKDEVDPIEILNALSDLLHSGSITTTITEDGVTLARAIISFAE